MPGKFLSLLLPVTKRSKYFFCCRLVSKILRLVVTIIFFLNFDVLSIVLNIAVVEIVNKHSDTIGYNIGGRFFSYSALVNLSVIAG